MLKVKDHLEKKRDKLMVDKHPSQNIALGCFIYW